MRCAARRSIPIRRRRSTRRRSARYFTSADTTVTRVAFSRRNTRRYVHVRMDVADVRRLPSAPPFNWSSYAFARGRQR